MSFKSPLFAFASHAAALFNALPKPVNDFNNDGDVNDTVILTAGSDQANLGTGNDTVNAGAGADVVMGGAGDDTLKGGDGGDRLLGGSENDRLSGEQGDDLLSGGAGDDTLSGGAGFDTADFRSERTAVNVNLAAEWATGVDIGLDRLFSIEQVYGGAGDDMLIGGERSDRLAGNAGNDELYGRAGGDILNGGAGDDRINGGLGNDTLIGGGGSDTVVFDDYVNLFPGYYVLLEVDLQEGIAQVSRLFSHVVVEQDRLRSIEHFVGGDGFDRVRGSHVANTLEGGGGSDRLSGGDGNDTLRGGADSDRLTGDKGADLLEGGDGHDTLIGYSDDDGKRLHGDVMDGGEGIYDTVSYEFFRYGVTVDLSTESAAARAGGKDTIRNVEVVIGGAGKDSLTGDANDNILEGGDGADVLRGGGGADQLFGRAGDDLFYGASDGDSLFGGSGEDTLSYAGFKLRALVDLEEERAIVREGPAAQGEEAVFNIENIIGGDADDSLYGDAEKNVILGGKGNDLISSGGLSPEDPDGQIVGSDVLKGEEGDDVLISYGDGHHLYGGVGKDTFVIKEWSNDIRDETFSHDVIEDFVEGERIDLTDFDLPSEFFTVSHQGGDTTISLLYQRGELIIKGEFDLDFDDIII